MRSYSKSKVHVPAPPDMERLRKAASKARLISVRMKASQNTDELKGEVRQMEMMVSGAVAIIQCVYLHVSVSSLEMQERWTIELFEEEQRAIVSNMTSTMTQRCRFDGFIAELHTRGQCKIRENFQPLLEANPTSFSRLVYCSAAQFGFTEDILTRITTNAIQKNQKVNITGHILYVPPFLFQVLEGTAENVCSLFETLWADDRHHTVSLVSFTRVQTRIFQDHMKCTVIHPFHGLKGSVVVSIFQNVGHRFMTKQMYASKTRDVPWRHTRTVLVIVFVFSFQPEKLEVVLDPVIELIRKYKGEILKADADRITAVSEDTNTNFVELGTAVCDAVSTLITDCRFGLAKGRITRVPIESRIHVGTCIDRATFLASKAKNSQWSAIVDTSASYLLPQPRSTVDSVPNAFLIEKDCLASTVTAAIPLITFPELPVVASESLVRLTYVSCSKSIDIAAEMYNFIHSKNSFIADKMILMKSADCRIILHIMEGTLSELLDLYALIRKNKLHKYCFQTSITPLKELIFSSEYAPLQVVSGDHWCPILKVLIKVVSKTDHSCPEVLKKLAAANQAPSAVGIIPMGRQIFATIIPVCCSIQGLCECYRQLVAKQNETWVEVIEISQRFVIACREGYIVRLIHLCVYFAGIIKKIPRAWCAIGVATGRGLSGHIGKANPIFFISGEAPERSHTMASWVINKPNSHGSCMLICTTSAALARLTAPEDTIVGIGSMGLHALPTWNVYSVDHPNTDTISRSLSSTYYLVPRPLVKCLPEVMSADNYVPKAPWMVPGKKKK